MKPHAHEEKKGPPCQIADDQKQEAPEGLKRERKGPLDKNVGDHKER